jgi:hypothetical protein
LDNDDVCHHLAKSLSHKCFFGILERAAAQLDLPKASDHVVLIPEMHRKNCELKDVEGRTWIWHARRIGTLGPR